MMQPQRSAPRLATDDDIIKLRAILADMRESLDRFANSALIAIDARQTRIAELLQDHSPTHEAVFGTRSGYNLEVSQLHQVLEGIIAMTDTLRFQYIDGSAIVPVAEIDATVNYGRQLVLTVLRAQQEP